jgi:hypothetical protein
VKHNPHTASLAVRALLERTSRIAKTLADGRERDAHLHSLKPAQRPWDSTWANAWQAYRLTAEQVHGPTHILTGAEAQAIHEAVQVAMPELFADYWEELYHKALTGKLDEVAK